MTELGFLKSMDRQFRYYKSLGEKAMAQLEEQQLFIQPNADTNSIAMVVKHLHGNMLSRWTDFLTTDGEKPWRQRDAEFENDLPTREAVMQKWEDGWDCLFKAMGSITDNDLGMIIYIRNEGHTVLDAFNRQLAHYSYHIGQIVYAAKLYKKGEWDSLSVPRNKSAEYNQKKFSEDKGTRHFTDEWLKKDE